MATPSSSTAVPVPPSGPAQPAPPAPAAQQNPAPVPPPTLKEIKMNTPTPFEGDRRKLDDFLMEVEMYLRMNYRLYNTAEKQIIFALSYMSGGSAILWKQSFWRNCINTGTFGSWDDFKTALRTSFDPADKEGDAVTKLQSASMTGKTADEFIEEFKIYQGNSGVKEDRPLIEWFMAALPNSLRDKILQMETPPTTIQGWYTTASKFDNNWRKWKTISSRLKGESDTKKKGIKFPPRYTPPVYNDPNAMDTREDFIKARRMTIEEREKHIRNGLCFRCHQTGHVARECALPGPSRSRQVNNTYHAPTPAPTSPTPSPPSIKSTIAADAFAQMRAIYKGLSDEEQTSLIKSMESTGF